MLVWQHARAARRLLRSAWVLQPAPAQVQWLVRQQTAAPALVQRQ
jgi:hypothetical protein